MEKVTLKTNQRETRNTSDNEKSYHIRGKTLFSVLAFLILAYLRTPIFALDHTQQEQKILSSFLYRVVFKACSQKILQFRCGVW